MFQIKQMLNPRERKSMSSTCQHCYSTRVRTCRAGNAPARHPRQLSWRYSGA